MNIPRQVERLTREALTDRTVFLTGPRQVGKTTIVRRIIDGLDEHVAYLDYDHRRQRSDMYARTWPGSDAVAALDEMLRCPHWTRLVKPDLGKARERLRFLLTGSLRLDSDPEIEAAVKGGCRRYRLHPLSCAELASSGEPAAPEPGGELPISPDARRGAFDALLQFGGFPEPFLARSDKKVSHWRWMRRARFFKKDIQEVERIRKIARLRRVVDNAALRVGLALPVKPLAKKAKAFPTVASHWLDSAEKAYYIFRLRPYRSPKIKALVKFPKVYFWDVTAVPAPAARLENVVALHLLKLCNFYEDRDGLAVRLHHLRDYPGRETNFLVTVDNKPWFAVDVRLEPERIPPALRYYKDRLQIPWAYQIFLEGNQDFVQDGVRCLPVWKFLGALV